MPRSTVSRSACAQRSSAASHVERFGHRASTFLWSRLIAAWRGGARSLARKALAIALLSFLLPATGAYADTPPQGSVVDIAPAGEITWLADLLGNDYTRFPARTVFECRDACFADGKCLAWTFVKAGFQGADPVCYFKNPVPATAYRNNCCASGIAPPWSEPVVVDVPPIEKEASQTDLPGNDYSRFEVRGYSGCFLACWLTPSCRAITFVQAGVEGEKAVCYFKDPVPTTAYRNRCCTSYIFSFVPRFWLPDPSPAAGIDFSGSWMTQTSTGNQLRMTLSQSADGRVSGTYADTSGTNVGRIDSAVVVGNQLRGTWDQGAANGGFTFKMLPGANAFRGFWNFGSRAVDPSSADGTWDGTR